MEIVGRARELGELRQALTQALSGTGRLVLISGEPGIGKTRLVDELAGAARGAGVPAVWGRAWEAGGAPAYWPLTSALEPLMQDLDDAAVASLRASLGDGAMAALAVLLPELVARAGATGATPPSADEARFRLFRAVAALLRKLAAPSGLVLVLEDLHAADEPSLLLLHFIARELRGMRLLVVGTFRDTETGRAPDLQEMLARIGREGTTLALARLSREEALRLVAGQWGALSGAAAGAFERIFERIVERSSGNPLFLEELARAQLQLPHAGSEVGQPLPGAVRIAIRQRLDQVPADTRALLELCAVAGDDVDPALLALAAALPRSVIDQYIEQARRAGLWRAHATPLRFGHALMREVLYDGLDEERRRALHGAVARALEDPARATSKATAAERAHHLLAGPVALLDQAVDAAVAASEEALAQLGYEGAVQVLERGLAAVESAVGQADAPGSVAGTAARARLCLALGRAHIRSGDGVRGKVYCREAARLARTLDDAPLLARAALSYGQVLAFGIVDPVLIDLLEEALAALPAPSDAAADPPSPLRDTLRARLAAALQPAPRTMEPVQMAREAIAGARRVNDRRHLLETIAAGMAAMMDVAPPRERLALNLEAEELALAVGDEELRLRAVGRLVIDNMGLHDFAQADVRIAAFERLAREQHAPWVAWRGPLFRSMRALVHGRFAEAEALIAEAARIGQEARDAQCERCVALHRESFFRVAERFDDLLAQEVVCRRHRADFVVGHAWHASAAALIACRMEDRERTRLHLGMVPGESFPPIDNLFALFFLAEPVAFAGDIAQAEVLHRLISAVADEDVVLGMTQLSWEGPAVRLLALLEARLSRFAEADAHFEAAVALLTQLQAGPLLARTRYEWGRAWLGRDQRRALALIAAAQVEAEALGMTGLVALAQARLGSARPTPGAGVPVVVAAEAATPTNAPMGPAPGALPFTFSAEGEVWAISHQGATFRLKDSLGLRYLARLLGEPDREIHVLELAGGEGGEGGEVADAGDAGELLDDEARQSYKERADDLRAELDEATGFGDVTRAARLREELAFLTAELSRAVGLGGRARRAGGAAERARSAVQRRIKNALTRLGEHDPALAAYLTRAVKTGNFCVFRPPR